MFEIPSRAQIWKKNSGPNHKSTQNESITTRRTYVSKVTIQRKGVVGKDSSRLLNNKTKKPRKFDFAKISYSKDANEGTKNLQNLLNRKNDMLERLQKKIERLQKRKKIRSCRTIGNFPIIFTFIYLYM